MKKPHFLFLLMALIFTFDPVQAHEDEPNPFPEWATWECIQTIATIVQHESGNMHSVEVYHFMAAQIIMDAEKMGCQNLTQWRWAIRSRPDPHKDVLWAVLDWPTGYPKCRFVGYPGDVAVWRNYGYRAKIDYSFRVGRLTVVGADCHQEVTKDYNKGKPYSYPTSQRVQSPWHFEPKPH